VRLEGWPIPKIKDGMDRRIWQVVAALAGMAAATAVRPVAVVEGRVDLGGRHRRRCRVAAVHGVVVHERVGEHAHRPALDDDLLRSGLLSLELGECHESSP